jgi:hypothetical protein
MVRHERSNFSSGRSLIHKLLKKKLQDSQIIQGSNEKSELFRHVFSVHSQIQRSSTKKLDQIKSAKRPGCADESRAGAKRRRVPASPPASARIP